MFVGGVSTSNVIFKPIFIYVWYHCGVNLDFAFELLISMGTLRLVYGVYLYTSRIHNMHYHIYRGFVMTQSKYNMMVSTFD